MKDQNLSSGGPFDLEDDSAYRRWRDAKLAVFPAGISDLIVEIGDLANPGEDERRTIVDRCRRANMAIYCCRADYTDQVRLRNDLIAFAHSFGLARVEGHRSAARDGVVALQVSGDETRKGYIPYTDRPLSWHTDGYYNAAANRIRAFILHCARDAMEGGENGFLDPEIAYIRMRDENPEFISAFMHEEAMTIPENVEGDGKVRPASIGPVFCVDPQSGALNMRYTARTRSIAWRSDPETEAAVRFLNDILNGADPLFFSYKLKPGQGVICNNVLHCRTQFQDAQAPSHADGRLLYRLRYLDRIAGTGPDAEANLIQQRGEKWPS